MNVTNETSNTGLVFTENLRAALISIGSIQIVANLPSVLVLLWIIIRRQRIKNLSYLSLGLSDSLTGVALLWLFVQPTTQILGFHHCLVKYISSGAVLYSSPLHVIGICILRLRTLLFPAAAHNQQNSLRPELIVIGTVWFVAISLSVSLFVSFRNEYDEGVCSIYQIAGSKSGLLFICIAVTFAVITCLILAASIVLFGILMKRWFKKTNVHPTGTGSTTMAWEVKGGITALLVAALYLGSFLPLVVVRLTDSDELAREICLCLSQINSVLNPVVFFARVPDFVKILKKMFRCGQNTSMHPVG